MVIFHVMKSFEYLLRARHISGKAHAFPVVKKQDGMNDLCLCYISKQMKNSRLSSGIQESREPQICIREHAWKNVREPKIPTSVFGKNRRCDELQN